MEYATPIPLSTPVSVKQKEWVQQPNRAGKLPAISKPLPRCSRNRILTDTPVQRTGYRYVAPACPILLSPTYYHPPSGDL